MLLSWSWSCASKELDDVVMTDRNKFFMTLVKLGAHLEVGGGCGELGVLAKRN